MGYKAWTVWSARKTGWPGEEYIYDKHLGTERWLLDIVFADDDLSGDDVRRSLVDHDGYPTDIYVTTED